MQEVLIITDTFKKLPLKKQIKILNSAADVFAEEGYHFGNISDICKKAEISNGALYKYFKNKENLFLSVLDYGINLVERKLYKPYIIYRTSIFDSIETLLNKIVIFADKNMSHLKIYSNLGASSMNYFADISSIKYKKATSNYIYELVEKAKLNNEIKDDMPTYMAACLIDNYILLFAYSIVSKYHKNRFNTFFNIYKTDCNIDDQIKVILETLKYSLS